MILTERSLSTTGNVVNMSIMRGPLMQICEGKVCTTTRRSRRGICDTSYEPQQEGSFQAKYAAGEFPRSRDRNVPRQAGREGKYKYEKGSPTRLKG